MPTDQPRAQGALPTSHRVMRIATSALLATLALGLWQQRSTPLAARHLDRANPWRGLPGCLWLAGTEGQAQLWPATAHSAIACGPSLQQPAALAPQAAVPPHAQALLNQLQPWLAAPPQARAGLPNVSLNAGLAASAGSSPRISNFGGQAVQQGASIQLAIVAADQSRAQTVADCMTGHADACSAAGVPPSRWQHQHEGAAVRMAALAQIDIASGAIEVLASAHSPCFERDALHQAASPDRHVCPDIAHAPARPQAWQIDNHALYGSAMLGSLVKPVLALALLRSDLGPQLQTGAGRQRLLRALQTSDTPALLDQLYCRDQQFTPACTRPALLPQAAADLGLRGDLQPMLLGHGDGLRLPAARMLHLPVGQESAVAMPMPATAPGLRAACSARDWSQCDGEALASQTAQLWGAGDTRGSPLAMAASFQRLGAAANQAGSMVPPHLAQRIETGSGLALPAQAAALSILAQHAGLIAQGMGLTHRADAGVVGTAHSACIAVFGSLAKCNSMGWLAGKTGTPGFKHDRLTLIQRRGVCNAADEQARLSTAAGKPVAAAVRAELARCAMAPVKWYAALVKDPTAPAGPWRKVVVVLTERNWSRTTGKVDSALDRGTPNVAAELAMRYLAAGGGAAP